MATLLRSTMEGRGGSKGGDTSLKKYGVSKEVQQPSHYPKVVLGT
jgi:hypothetical protein